VAMTGEITLRGKVLPIGGLKEKLLAAHRGGLTTVIIPKENEKDLVEIPIDIIETLQINVIETMDDVLQIALERLPSPRPPASADLTPPLWEPAPPGSAPAEGVVTG